MKGTVLSVFLNKGYAFIRGVDRRGYFAHVRQFQCQECFDTLMEGLTVAFVPDEGERGPRALDIEVCSNSHVHSSSLT